MQWREVDECPACLFSILPNTCKQPLDKQGTNWVQLRTEPCDTLQGNEPNSCMDSINWWSSQSVMQSLVQGGGGGVGAGEVKTILDTYPKPSKERVGDR